MLPRIGNGPVFAAEVDPDKDQHQHENIQPDKECVFEITLLGKPDAGNVFPVGLGECFEKDLDVREHHYPAGHDAGNHDSANEAVIADQLLQPEEIPRSFGRVGRVVRVGRPFKRRIEQNRNQAEEGHHGEHHDQLADDEFRPGEHHLTHLFVHLGLLALNDLDELVAAGRLKDGSVFNFAEFLIRNLLFFRGVSRPGQPAILADAEKVNGNQKAHNGRKDGHVEHVETDEGLAADIGVAQQNTADKRPAGSNLRNLGSDFYAPEGQLVPRKQIAGVGKEYGQQAEDAADRPVKLAPAPVCPGKVDPEHVQGHEGHHAVCRPAVHIAKEPAPEDVTAQVEHPAVSIRQTVRTDGGGRNIVEHQQDSRHRQDQEKVERHQPQPHRGLKLNRPLVDLHRLDMQQHIAEHDF